MPYAPFLRETYLHEHTLDVRYIIHAPSFMHHWDSWYFDSRPPSCSEMPYQPSTQGHYHIRRSHISLRVNLSFQSWNWNFMIHLTSDQVSKFAASIGFLFLLDRPNLSSYSTGPISPFASTEICIVPASTPINHFSQLMGTIWRDIRSNTAAQYDVVSSLILQKAQSLRILPLQSACSPHADSR